MSCGVYGLSPRAAAALRLPHRCGGLIPSRRREGQGETTTATTTTTTAATTAATTTATTVAASTTTRCCSIEVICMIFIHMIL